MASSWAGGENVEGVKRVTAWYPLLFGVGVSVGLAVVHVIAFHAGHTTVSGADGSQVRFWLPPISLTGNRTPEYFLYALTTLVGGVSAIKLIAGFNTRLSKALTDLSAARSRETGSNSDHFAHHHLWAHGGNATGERHAILDDDASVSVFTLNNPRYTDVRKPGLCRRPLLLVAYVFSLIAAASFLIQGLVPIQGSALQDIGADCYWYEPDGSRGTVGQAMAGSMKDVARHPSGVMAGATPILNGTERVLTSPMEDPEGRSQSPAGPAAPAAAAPARLLAPNTDDFVLSILRLVDPSRPRPASADEARVQRAGPDPEGHVARVFCPELNSVAATASTGAHAIAALSFFVSALVAMDAFTLWLCWRFSKAALGCRRPVLVQPSFSSMAVKLPLAVLPWLKPLELGRSFFLRYLSLLEWSGLSQRFVVLCILLYIASLGFEIKSVRKSLDRLRDITRPN